MVTGDEGREGAVVKEGLGQTMGDVDNCSESSA